MVFVVGHFNTLLEAQAVQKHYALQYDEVVICGSSFENIAMNKTLAYHPIFKVQEITSVKEQHAYIDSMLRAVQIEVPEKVILHSKTMLDTDTVLFRIKQHCAIVGVEIINETPEK